MLRKSFKIPNKYNFQPTLKNIKLKNVLYQIQQKSYINVKTNVIF